MLMQLLHQSVMLVGRLGTRNTILVGNASEVVSVSNSEDPAGAPKEAFLSTPCPPPSYCRGALQRPAPGGQAVDKNCAFWTRITKAPTLQVDGPEARRGTKARAIATPHVAEHGLAAQ